VKLPALALAACLGGAGAAAALEFNVNQAGSQTIIIGTGPFVRGDADRLAALLRQTRNPDAVVFRSPGGNALEGMAVGRTIRRAGVGTHLPRGYDCASACTYAFLGGRVRTADEGARYGVHMFTVAGNDAMMQRIAGIIREGGSNAAAAVVQFIEQDSARFAAQLAYYSVEMGVSLRLLEPNFTTENVTVRWLSGRELRDLNVVNAN
jgi:hypothetical protein